MRVFGAIVIAQSARSMQPSQLQKIERRCVGSKAVGRDRLRRDGLVSQQLPQQPQSCMDIALFLHDDIKHLAFVVDGAPDVYKPAANPGERLIEVPAR
jgi:hypothetical protein